MGCSKVGTMDDMTKNHLSPRRHKTGDLFVADLVDIGSKDDLTSMEHPLFALRAGDKRARKYERNGVQIEILPGHTGHATIHDKDVWIYCISQLTEAINRGRLDISRNVEFTAYDFLVSTNRPTSGNGYKRMKEALTRLKGTTVITNAVTGGRKSSRGFGLIDSWEILEADDDGRMVSIEVELPKWLMRAIEAHQVLSINKEYFQLRKPLDRRIYELARKHCGSQPKWKVSLKVLHEKTGSRDALRNFRVAIRSLAESNQLPDYRVRFDKSSDMLSFYSRKGKGQLTELLETLNDPCG